MAGPSSTRRGWRLNDDRNRLDVVFDDTVLFSLDGTGISWFDQTPVARPSAYTQTYSTADKTHAAMTSADHAAPTNYTAHASGATTVTSNAATDLDTAAAALDTLEDEFTVLSTQFDALRADVIDVKNLANSIIDDLQGLGLVQ